MLGKILGRLVAAPLRIVNVLGFIFNRDLDEVALLLKSRPRWQAGLYNGVGGHIEMGEHPLAAMIREAREEVGFAGAAAGWEHFATMLRAGDFECRCFRYHCEFECLADIVQQREDQPLLIANPREPVYPAVSNLAWLLGLALDVHPTGYDGSPGYDVTARVGRQP
jgi:8-oxo-dGTP diphosphatase